MPSTTFQKANTVTDNHSPVTENPWRNLRKFTDARIGLGRAGISLPTQELLKFQLAHALAQDAVHLPLDTQELLSDLQRNMNLGNPMVLHTLSKNRFEYLQRPDFGRQLNEESRQCLIDKAKSLSSEYDLAIVIVDGLSSQAAQHNTLPMLQALLNQLSTANQSWQIAPVCIVEQGRVAVGDDVGKLLNAKAVLVMIGERPGLSSPDSLGLYLTWQPKPGRTDAERNCISNVRPAGLSYSEAAIRLHYLLSESRRLKLTGVNLKDRTESASNSLQKSAHNFLVTHK